ncbi:MAG: flagellar export protein FliJ [Desulfuromonas sp.]|uniref:flagellar export protein FliJ n=1 Tax=Desulfuromonas sp. TaxID=892 RepID=UPI000CC7CAAC|nr:flagellar export protein FliJ [Desulfuromonas sp.]PLX84496.1 MAG: flagellar export protein FliJ [Desulfuromonas sp.]
MERFKLQPVLDYRQNLEHQARQQLAEVLARESELRLAIERERDNLEGLYAELIDRQRQGIGSPEQSLFQTSIGQRRATLRELTRRLDEVGGEVEARRDALREAGKEKRLLEKLKEKRELEWQQRLRHKETLFLDEVALSSLNR